MKLSHDELKSLMKNKLMRAGLSEEHSDMAATVLTWSDERGYHSHGAVRVEYYCERISKGGMTINPTLEFKVTGPCTGIYEGDNGCGYVAATLAMEQAIKMAKENGAAIIGVRNISHSGALGFYTEMAANAGLVSIAMCQSDPMAVPYGGSQPYYGTNPISFGAPTADQRQVIFDMATTVKAWGKVLHARSKNEPIPSGWAVDENGKSATDASKVNALVPIAEAKGYGLMMMVDTLAGVLLGVPFGRHVSSMYKDLTRGRELGQLFIVIDPERFGGLDLFKKSMSTVLDELAEIKPAEGFDRVRYPGEGASMRRENYFATGGIEIVDEIYEYLIGDAIHFDRYHGKNRFAE